MAFSARREGDEESQIYILDIAGGGDQQRVTSLSTGASAPQWRPDGKALLFGSAVYPGAADDEANRRIAAERRARKYNARVFESFPIRHWDQWVDDRRVHPFVQALGEKARGLLAGTRLAAEPGFSSPPAPLAGEDLEAAWAPDGQSVVFAATSKRNTAAYASYGMHLHQVAAAGGEPRQLTTGQDSYSGPVFRPDGRALYCTYSKEGMAKFTYGA